MNDYFKVQPGKGGIPEITQIGPYTPRLDVFLINPDNYEEFIKYMWK